mgnify:FL=1
MPRLNIDDLSSELEKLDGQDGITPEAVVGVARDPSNVLHAHFEWDDAKAGHAHRLQQARQLIKRVKITTPTGSTTPKYVSVKIVSDEGDRVYEPIERVVLDQTKWSFVLGETLTVVDEASEKIEVLTELAANPEQSDLARNMKRTCFDLREMASNAV